MSEPSPRDCAAAEEPPAPAGPPPRTSDYYCVDENLPVRFNNPAWFRGYGTKEPVSMYRTSNQAYGSRAPTVHEMPKCLMADCSGAFPHPINSSVPFRFQKVFYPNSSKFSRQLAAGGMFRNNTFNVYMEKSIVTGPDNYITSYDRFNFHPSYNINRPSICD